MIIGLIDFLEREYFPSLLPEEKRRGMTFLFYDLHGTALQRALIFVFAKGASSPAFVAKFPKSSDYEPVLEEEYRNHQALYAGLAGELQAVLPRPLGMVSYGGVPIMIETGVSGRSMSKMLRRSRNRRRKRAVLEKAVGLLSALQRGGAARKRFDQEAIAAQLDRPLNLFAEKRGISQAQINRLQHMRDEVAAYLPGVSPVPVHGDYWPSNIIVDGGDLRVIDWTYCTPAFLPFWDYLTLLFMVQREDAALGGDLRRIMMERVDWLGKEPGLEKAMRVVYCAIRSVWSEFRFGVSSGWDMQWKVLFEREVGNG